MNSPEQIALIGDIHGCNEQLEVLIDTISRRFGSIPIYATGDLVDRGPNSKGVINTLLKHNVQSCLGNHDDWVVQLITRSEVDDFVLSEIMGGRATLKSYIGQDVLQDMDMYSSTVLQDIFTEFRKSLPQSHIDYFTSMPLVKKIETQKLTVILSHGGIDTKYFNKPYQDQQTREWISMFLSPSYDNLQLLQQDKVIAKKLEDEILWGRPQFKEKKDTVANLGPNTYQVFGHTPLPQAIVKSHFAAIDTGVCFSDLGHLTAVILPSKETISVRNFCI